MACTLLVAFSFFRERQFVLVEQAAASETPAPPMLLMGRYVLEVLLAALLGFAIESSASEFSLVVELTGVDNGAARWADYDNDGDFDLFVTGRAPYALISLYRNDGAMQFVDIRPAVPAFSPSPIAWGDYDLDGDLDVIHAGLAAEVYQNNPDYAFSAIGSGLPPFDPGTAEWNDFNGDGAPDLLLCPQAGTGGVRIYTNNKGSFLPTALMPGEINMAAAAADYDNDGDLDILTTRSDRCHLFVNNGVGTFVEVPVNLPGVTNGSLAWNDFDQDGWVDFALVGSTNALASGSITRVYRNNGDGTFVDTESSLEGVRGGAVVWADYDNDGDSDLLVSGRGKTGGALTRLYTNERDAGFTSFSADLPQMQATLAWGDMDSDNDLDLFMAGMAATGRVSRIYRNHTGVTNSAPHPPRNLGVTLVEDNGVVFEWSPGSDAETGDSDGLTDNLRVGTSPGAIDVMAPAADLETGFYRIPGPGNVRRNMWRLFDLPRGTYYWSVQTIDSGWMGSRFSSEASFTITNARPTISQLPDVRLQPFDSTNLTFVVGDFESLAEDLLLEVASSNTNVVPLANIVLEGLGSNRTVRVIGGRFPGTTTVSIIARDERGGSRSRSFGVAVEDFSVLPLTIPGFGGHRAAWGDYDNDRDLDLAITGTEGAGYSGPGRVLRNDGGGSFSQVLLVESSERPEWVDLDNDGYLELIMTHVSGTYLYSYDRQGGFVRLDQTLLAVRGISVADFDNDGDFDVLQKGPSWAEGVVTRLFRNDGNNLFSVASTIFPDLPSNGAMEWSDYEYDGDWDVLLGGDSQSLPLKLYRNETRGAFVETEVNLPWDSREISWIDYDNDRRVDVIVPGTRVFKNLGNSFTNTVTGFPLSGYNNGVWGDFDGDGWHDVMLAGALFVNHAGGRIFRNLRNGDFVEIQAGLPALTDDGSAWGDYDRDGDLDLVLAGGLGPSAGDLAFMKLVRNNSAVSNALPSIPTNLSATVRSGGEVILNWSPSTDSGVWASITYNLRVGTTPGGIDVMTPDADLATGWRRVARVGNAGATNFWKLWLPPGQYYWSVQAIDSSFAGSQFSEEGTFVITAPVIVQKVINSGRMNLRFSGAAGLQYSVQASSDLTTWSVAGAATEFSPGVFEFVDPSANQGSRFYRISSP
jgi:hypothetical protein